MERVLVTRPEPGASRSAARLARLGFAPVLFPLTRIVPRAPREWPDPARIDAVAVTSANALRHAPAALIAAYRGRRVFAVGARSAEAARAAGLGPVEEAESGDADGLARRMAAALAPASRVTVLTGRVRRTVLEERLEAAGHGVGVVAVYDTLDVAPSDGDVDNALDGRPVDGVLLYSAGAAAGFGALLLRPAIAPLIADAALFCLSARVAERLPADARMRARIAARPREEDLLAMLKTRA